MAGVRKRPTRQEIRDRAHEALERFMQDMGSHYTDHTVNELVAALGEMLGLEERKHLCARKSGRRKREVRRLHKRLGALREVVQAKDETIRALRVSNALLTERARTQSRPDKVPHDLRTTPIL